MLSLPSPPRIAPRVTAEFWSKMASLVVLSFDLESPTQTPQICTSLPQIFRRNIFAFWEIDGMIDTVLMSVK